MKKLTLITVMLLFAAIGVRGQNLNPKFTTDGNIGVTFGKADFFGFKTDLIPTFQVEYIPGFMLNNNVFLGVGVGYNHMFIDGTERTNFLPIFGDFKYRFPNANGIRPYLMMDLGYGIELPSKYKTFSTAPGGFYMKVGAGLNFNKFNIAIGYNRQNITDKSNDSDFSYSMTTQVNSFFFQVGFHLE